MIKVLFVCMGNICRSPLAEGLFKDLLEKEGLAHAFHVDSAGTIGYHAGSPPDRRSVETLARVGIDITNQRSRQVKPSDFDTFDYIIAMDKENMATLEAAAPVHTVDRLHMFLPFAPELDMQEMPDPYYGGTDGFDLCLRAGQKAAKGLLNHIKGEQRV